VAGQAGRISLSSRVQKRLQTFDKELVIVGESSEQKKKILIPHTDYARHVGSVNRDFSRF